jgi:glycosyltransferase involved in cell wall biosynthesis
MNDALIPLLAQIDQALNQGDLELAETLLRLVEDQDPGTPDGAARLGLVRMRQGQMALAEIAFLTALKTAPEAASLWFHIGLCRMDGDGGVSVTSAFGALAAAIALDPAFFPAYHALGSKALTLTPPPNVRHVLLRAHRLVPENDDIIDALDLAVLTESRAVERISDAAAQAQALARNVGPVKRSDHLKITFIDPMNWDYDVGSPDVKPLGGSQSAMCYLARALARRGHSVSTITGTKNPTSVFRVDCRRHADGLPSGPDAPDIVIVLNGPDIGPAVRDMMPKGRPLVLWTQHAHDQSAMRFLEQARIQNAYDALVCVSDWHAHAVRLRYGLNDTPIFVQRNGIGPRFEALADHADEFRATKSGVRTLVYSSTPFRGLDILLDAFPQIRAAHGDVELAVYSSLQVYNSAGSDPYQLLYDRARAMPGVHYFGSVGQAQLAHALANAHVLSYPNTFPETSCITVMEAMAAGLDAVTSHLAALPETGLGLARLVPFPPGPPDREKFVSTFAATVIKSLDEQKSNEHAWISERINSARRVAAAANWDRRAQEWEMLIAKLVWH